MAARAAIAPMAAASFSFSYYWHGETVVYNASGSNFSLAVPQDKVLGNLQINYPFSGKKNKQYSVRMKFNSNVALNQISILAGDKDGFYQSFASGDLKVSQNGQYVFDFDIIAPFDVTMLYFSFQPSPYYGYSNVSLSVSELTVKETDNGGLFASIIKAVTDIWNGITQLPQKIASAIGGFFTALGNTIKDALTALGNFIINGIKGLFVPSDGYFEVFFERMNTFFSDRFGLLYFPVELFIDMIGRVGALGESAPYIQIPQVAWDGNVLIPAQRYDFPFLQEGQLKQIHDYYLMAMDVALIGALIALINKKYREVFAL